MARTEFEGAIFVPGDITLSGNIVPGISRSSIVQEDLAEYPILFASMRVHDNLSSLLPATAAADDFGLDGETFGTETPCLVSADAGSTTVNSYARFQFALPPEYVSGQSCRLSAQCGALTAVSDGTMTLDCAAYESDGEGGVSGSDLITTAAQSCNSLTLAEKQWALTSTSLTPGATIDVRLHGATTDAATASVFLKVAKVSLLLDIRG